MAFSIVDRGYFVPRHLLSRAYNDSPLRYRNLHLRCIQVVSTFIYGNININ